MAYIGRQSIVGNFVKLDAITAVNGQAAYTMQNNSVNFVDYSTVNQFMVSLNSVVQSPGSSFTVSGSTITFASNLVTGDVIDFIIVFGNSLSAGTPTDGTITAAKLASSSITGQTAETTVADDDLVLLSDTSASAALKKMTVANLTANAGVAGISSSADATAMTITSAEKIGIGETSPMALVHIKQADSGMSSVDTDVTQLVVEDDSTAGITILGGTSGKSTLHFGDGADNDVGHVEYDHASNYINFKMSGDNVMRLAGDREIFFTKIAESTNQTGTHWKPNGSQWQVLNAQGYNIINRSSDDGVYIYFKQAESTEGNISVSGTTVSYNGFTGTHWTRLADNSKPTILRGTVMESLDEMVDWYNLEFDVITQDDDGNDINNPQKIPHLLTGGQAAGDVITYNHNGTDYQATIVKEADIKHMKSKVSDTIDAKNVYGVFNYWDFGDDDGINDMIVASVGSFVVRIKSGETVAKGDLLQSNGDGTAKVQSDDNIKSSSFAKVLSTTKIETYEDGSFIVPCSLMC